MKTKIKRHSRSVLSVVLAVCMLVSCMTVGLIATDAAKTTEERLGAVDDSKSLGTSNTFTQYQTLFLKTGTSSCYDSSAVVKAWFNVDGSTDKGTVSPTELKSNCYYIVVPQSGANCLYLQRFDSTGN